MLTLLPGPASAPALIAAPMPRFNKRSKNRSNRRSLWSFLAASMLLYGCQTTVVDPDAGAADNFLVFGKMAVQAPAQSFSARFRWHNRAADFDMELWGPFGQGRTRLQGTPTRLSILNGKGEILQTGRPETVMLRTLGWELPVGALVHWVQGRVAPDLPRGESQRDAQGRLARLVQADWEVVFDSYQDLADGQARPRSLRLTKGPYVAKLILNRWES